MLAKNGQNWLVDHPRMRERHSIEIIARPTAASEKAKSVFECFELFLIQNIIYQTLEYTNKITACADKFAAKDATLHQINAEIRALLGVIIFNARMDNHVSTQKSQQYGAPVHYTVMSKRRFVTYITVFAKFSYSILMIMMMIKVNNGNFSNDTGSLRSFYTCGLMTLPLGRRG